MTRVAQHTFLCSLALARRGSIGPYNAGMRSERQKPVRLRLLRNNRGPVAEASDILRFSVCGLRSAVLT